MGKKGRGKKGKGRARGGSPPPGAGGSNKKAELIKLKTFFDELDRKQAIIDSEKARIQRRKKTLDKNIMIWFCAARMIQRYVHGYLEKKRKLEAKRARKARLKAKREAAKGPT